MRDNIAYIFNPIFIFNIDKTIIGDLYSLYNIIKKINDNDNDKIYRIEELKEKFIRPNFKDFIEFVKNKYKTVEFCCIK